MALGCAKSGMLLSSSSKPRSNTSCPERLAAIKVSDLTGEILDLSFFQGKVKILRYLGLTRANQQKKSNQGWESSTPSPPNLFLS
jgi:hypothetical protein